MRSGAASGRLLAQSTLDERDPSDEWPRVYDPRDRDEHDARDGLMRDLDLPRGDERELVVDRDRLYELDGEDSRTLAAVGAFRVVPEHDLNLPHDTRENLHARRLVVPFPDYRIEYEVDGRELHQDTTRRQNSREFMARRVARGAR
jgi:hypothetical protein